MEAIRNIYSVENKQIVINLPEKFTHKSLEVIDLSVYALEGNERVTKKSKTGVLRKKLRTFASILIISVMLPNTLSAQWTLVNVEDIVCRDRNKTSIAFLNENTGIIASSGLNPTDTEWHTNDTLTNYLQTDDSGLTWNFVASSPNFFVSAIKYKTGIGTAAGGYQNKAAIEIFSDNILERQLFQIPALKLIDDIEIIDNEHFIVLAQDLNDNYIVASLNFVQNEIFVSKIISNSATENSRIFFFSENQGYFITNNKIFYTTDGGESVSQIAENVFDYYFINENTGVYVGLNNSIFKTVNFGNYWNYQTSINLHGERNTLIMNSENTVYQISNILTHSLHCSVKFINFDTNETESFDLTLDEPEWMYPYFYSPNQGYLVCLYGRVYVTTNNGGLPLTNESVSSISGISLIENMLHEHLKLYIPNELQFSELRVSLFDVSGRTVLMQTVPCNSNYSEINVANLKSGIYIAKIFVNESESTFKIIKD